MEPELAQIDKVLDDEAYATDKGIKRVILPKAGYKSQARRDHEWQPWFRRGRRYHAGVEGRISGLKRCLNQGADGFASWVGRGIIANNLTLIGRKQATNT